MTPFDSCLTGERCFGAYAACNAETELCECTAANTELVLPSSGLYSEAKYCLPSTASTDDVRVFWSMSAYISAWGVLLSANMIYEFFHNKQLQYPNTVMQSFSSFVVPKFCLSVFNSIFYLFQVCSTLAS